MNDPDSSTEWTVSRVLLASVIVAVLLLFLSVPILFVLYGAAGAMGGLAMIGVFCMVQLPLFLLLMRIGLLPRSEDLADSAPDRERET